MASSALDRPIQLTEENKMIVDESWESQILEVQLIHSARSVRIFLTAYPGNWTAKFVIIMFSSTLLLRKLGLCLEELISPYNNIVLWTSINYSLIAQPNLFITERL